MTEAATKSAIVTGASGPHTLGAHTPEMQEQGNIFLDQKGHRKWRQQRFLPMD